MLYEGHVKTLQPHHKLHTSRIEDINFYIFFNKFINM